MEVELQVLSECSFLRLSIEKRPFVILEDMTVVPIMETTYQLAKWLVNCTQLRSKRTLNWSEMYFVTLFRRSFSNHNYITRNTVDKESIPALILYSMFNC